LEEDADAGLECCSDSVGGLMWFGYIEGLFVRLFCCRKPAVNVETRSSYLEASFALP